jgi:hypothetical protein
MQNQRAASGALPGGKGEPEVLIRLIERLWQCAMTACDAHVPPVHPLLGPPLNDRRDR